MGPCPHCGKMIKATPLRILGNTLEWALILVLLSYVTPEPGFYERWVTGMWWVMAIGVSLGSVMFVLASIVWLADPAGYHQPHSHR